MIKRLRAHFVKDVSDVSENKYNRYDAEYITLDTKNIVLATEIYPAYASVDYTFGYINEQHGYFRFVQMSSGQWLALRGNKEEDLYFDFDTKRRKQETLDKENKTNEK